jgi:hypothetical protein
VSYKITYKPLHIVLGNSGVTANTAALDDFIEEEKKRPGGGSTQTGGAAPSGE